MTQEDKDLLFKDLCARLPYGVKFGCDVKGVWTLKGITHNGVNYICWPNVVALEVVKPYLRPMSSMTEEENKEFSAIFRHWHDDELFDLIEEDIEYYIWKHNRILPDIFDWLNAHHFDYRGLIPKGLALEASEGMYNIN